MDNDSSIAELLEGARDTLDPLAFARAKADVVGRLFGVELTPPRVGRFEVNRLLGQGGMGRVYGAFDPLLRREVALKLLRSGCSVAVLRREARALARVAHPNVVTVYEIMRSEELVFLVSELVNGHPLQHWLSVAPRSSSEILQVLIGVGEGLAAVHEAALIHGDVKPNNIVVSSGGGPKLVDFGLATEIVSERSPAAHPAGTPGFMAPELVAGSVATALCDQYSFCAVLRAALSTVKDAHGTGWWRVNRVIARGMSPAPQERYASMTEVVAALRATPRHPRVFLGASLTGAALLALPGEEAPERPCIENAAEAIASVWTPERRNGLLTLPSTSIVPLVQAISDYASGWEKAFVHRCATTPVALHPGATPCLDATLRALDEVLSGFAEAGQELELRAAHEAIAALAPPSACGSRQAPPPRPKAASEELRDLEAALDEVESLGAAGKVDEGLTKAVEVLAAGRRLGSDRIVAEAQFTLGRIYHSLGRVAEAIDAFEEAAWTARVTGSSLRVAEVGARLVGLYARAGDDAAATAWAREAEASLRAGGGHPAIGGMLARMQGEAAASKGHYELAVSFFRRSLELVGPQTSQLDRAGRMSVLADALRKLGRADEAIMLLRQALELERVALGEHSWRLLPTLWAIGGCELELGRPAEAVGAFDQALALADLDAHAEPSAVAEVRAARDRARSEVLGTSRRP